MNKFGILRKLVKGEEIDSSEVEFLVGHKYMADFEDPIDKNLPFKYAFSHKNYIDKGVFGKVYGVSNSNNLAVKVSKEGFLNIRLIKGQEIQKYLEQKEFPVSHTLGICNVYDATEKKFRVGHVMEEIKGKQIKHLRDYDEISQDNSKKIDELIKEQKTKLKEIGFSSSYSNGPPLHNILWDAKNQRIVLIDFDNDHIWGEEFIKFKENEWKIQAEGVQ